MAEAAEHEPKPGEHGHDAHGAEHGGHGGGLPDPKEHIKDKVLFGVDAATGSIVRPFDSHGHKKHGYESYAPKMVGPFKLEFTQHMAGITGVSLFILLVGLVTAKRVLHGLHARRAPTGKLANAFEGVVLFIRDEMVEPIGGHHLGHYTPLFITYFLLILFCNFAGMIPEVGTATGNFSVTLSLGISVYVLIWILGFKHQGLHFIVNLVPPGTPWWLWLPMLVLEIMGPIIKCFVLAVRLYANMIAGHLIIGNILNLGIITPAMLAIGLPLCLGLSFLEVMVCLIQAYVFTLLSIIFIGGAVHAEH